MATARLTQVKAVVAVDPAYGDPAWADADDRALELARRGTAAPLRSLPAAFHLDADPALIASVVPVLSATRPRVLIESLRSTYTDADAFGHLPDTHRKLGRLAQPLLSLYADPAAAVRAEALPIHHRVEIIAGTGHFIPLEQPTILWHHIRRWLADVPTSASDLP